MGVNMRNKSDTYRKIYAKYRADREKEIGELKFRVSELERMIEYLCHKVFVDE